jgi:hypothetical protein
MHRGGESRRNAGARARRRARAAVVAGATAALSLAAWPHAARAAEPGQPSAAVYTAKGIRYEAVSGRLDDLFPKPGAGSSVAGDAPALAIDVVHPAGTTDRLLVPGTDGLEHEVEPSLVYEEATATLFVLWLARDGDGRAHILLAELAGGRWAEPVSVTRHAMVVESVPAVVLTRDSAQRTVLHLLWTADDRGLARSFYSPVVLFRGEYAGWNPIVELGTLDPHARATASAGPGALYHAGSVADGVDLRSVVVAYANQATDHLLTARSRVLPMGLVSFSDEARNHLIGVGGTWRRTGRELADAVAGHLEELDQEIHVGARAFLSRSARAFILKNLGVITPIEELGGALRGHLLDEGAGLLGQEFETAPQACALVEVGPDDAAQTEPATHVLEVCRIRARPLPAVGAEEVRIHASRDGGLVLVTWRENGVLRFRLSEGAGWTEPRSIEADGDADLLWKSLGR